MSTPAQRQALFDAFLKENPNVYSEIVARARAANKKGVRLGMRCLWENLRYDWSVKIRHPADTPRLNDWFAPLLARLIDQREPDLKNYFELRDRPSRPSESEAA